MASCLPILFASVEDPDDDLYRQGVGEIIQRPKILSALADQESRTDLLLQASTCIDRLTKCFGFLHTELRQRPSSDVGTKVSEYSIQLLLGVLPEAVDLPNIQGFQLVLFISSVLNLCFNVDTKTPASITKLARHITSHEALLEQFFVQEAGIKSLSQWVARARNCIGDSDILNNWVLRLVRTVINCIGDHEVSDLISNWGHLIDLRDTLRKVHCRALQKQSRNQSFNEKADTRNFKAPISGATEPSVRKGSTTTPLFELDEPTVSLLAHFQLSVPGSMTKLKATLEEVEVDRTAKIFQDLALTFPCRLCKSSLLTQSGGNSERAISDPGKVDSGAHNLDLGVLGTVTGNWRILLSVQALKSLHCLSSHFPAIKAKLDMLAAGHWDWKTKVAGSPKQRTALSIPLAITKVNRGTHILWQVDLSAANTPNSQQQVIKIWEVGKKVPVFQMIDRVITLQGSYSQVTCERCTARKEPPDKVQNPMKFESQPSHLPRAHQDTNGIDVRSIEHETLEIANKFYTLTEPVIRSVINRDLLAEFPFDPDTPEVEVISHFSSASLILGRSGTGKTTCLVFKLLAKFLIETETNQNRPARQVLLTRSRFLADKLRSYLARLIKSLTQFKPLREPSALRDGYQDHYLMTSALSLQDYDFPLVLTWDEFLCILENTVGGLDLRGSDVGTDDVQTPKADSGEVIYSRLGQKVLTFQDFKLDYWQSLPSHLKKDISTDLAFSEIMGVIKGSKFSRSTLSPLTRDDYVNLSERIAPNFTLQEDRHQIYSLYERFEEFKSQTETIDGIDRICTLLEAIRKQPRLRQLLASTFEEVYIDEVQDLRCMDIELLLEIVRDGRGFFLAGDTAQTISNDSNFRFADIKSLFYDHFNALSIETKQPQLARPILFPLQKNYRSQQSVLSLASMFMDLLWKAFPETVDKLQHEYGSLRGMKPVMFIGCGSESLNSTHIGLGDLSKLAGDFGAEQAIIVRDAGAKKKLRMEVGKDPLIFTILESKGMEFEDVVLFNIISSCQNQAALRRLRALYAEGSASFDSKKYAALCTELKQLYVAVTRARFKLFFIEESHENTSAITELLTHDVPEPLVTVMTRNDADFPNLIKEMRPGKTVDLERWKQRGQELYDANNLEDALLCFEKCKDTRKVALIQAKLEVNSGRAATAHGDHKEATVHFSSAADLFERIGQILEAADSLMKARKVEDATNLLLRHSYFYEAGRQLREALHYEEAANCFVKSDHFDQAADVLHEGRKFAQLIQFLDEYQGHLTPSALARYRAFCKIILRKGALSADLSTKAIRTIGAPSDMEAFYRQYKMQDALRELFAKQDRHLDLLRLLLESFELEEALRLALAHNLTFHTEEPLRGTIVHLIHYVCAQHLIVSGDFELCSFMDSALAGHKLSASALEAFQLWRCDKDVSARKLALLIRNHSMSDHDIGQTFRDFQVISKSKDIAKAHDIDNLPFQEIHNVMIMVKELVIQDSQCSWRIVNLIAGVWVPDDPDAIAVAMAWSPLKQISGGVQIEIKEQACRYVFEKLGNAVQSLHEVTKELWKKKWPKLCRKFVIRGRCPPEDNCTRTHVNPSTTYFENFMQDLIQMNYLLCSFTPIFLRHVMSEDFQKRFLGIRRYWLEQLVRNLTYVSPLEQDVSLLKRLRLAVHQNDVYATIRSALENRLYYQLREEFGNWGFSFIVDQVASVMSLGPHVLRRYYGSLRFKLRNAPNGIWMTQHLDMLGELQLNAEDQNPERFRTNLRLFCREMNQVDPDGLSSLHAITGAIEHLATYLIIKTSPDAFVIPLACLELYVPWLSKDTLPQERPLHHDKWVYQESLIILLDAFCSVLFKVSKAREELGEGPDGPTKWRTYSLTCGGSAYNQAWIQQRGIDIIVLALLTLFVDCHASESFTRLCARVQEVIELPFTGARAWRHNKLHDVRDRLLVRNFLKYNGKNPLVVVAKDVNQLYGFSVLRQEPSVIKLSHEELRNRLGTVWSYRLQKDTSLFSAETANNEQTSKQIEAAQTILHFWRARHPKLQVQRAWLQTPRAKVIARFIEMGSHLPRPDPVRIVLVDSGVKAQLHLASTREVLCDKHEAASSCVNELEIEDGSYVFIDEVLQRLDAYDSNVKNLEQSMTTEELMSYVKTHNVQSLEDIFFGVERMLREVDLGLRDAEATMGAMEVETKKARKKVRTKKRKEGS